MFGRIWPVFLIFGSAMTGYNVIIQQLLIERGF